MDNIHSFLTGCQGREHNPDIVSALTPRAAKFSLGRIALLCHSGKMRKPAMLYPVLLLIFWSGLVLTADKVEIENSVRQFRSVNFASTIGKMVQSEVGRGLVSHRGVEIGYNYAVNGINYTGHRYRYDDRNAAWEYSEAVDAYPRWSARKVYYNPSDPADSVLDPGLDGCDLLLLLFATPLNVVTLALWAAVIQSKRAGRVNEPAGGVRIVRKGGEIRAQLATIPPAAAALAGLGASSFFLAFPVVSLGGFTPSMKVMLVVWSLVLTAMAAAFAWSLRKNRSGDYDLRIDEISKAVTVPQILRRRMALRLARNEIVGVSLQCRITKTPSGDYHSYLPAIDCVANESECSSIKLTSWGWPEAKASAFCQWLGEQLGVEFKGVHRA
jgi:hypothetical protein